MKGILQKQERQAVPGVLVHIFTEFFGRPCGIRTCDQRIKSPLLYQLS